MSRSASPEPRAFSVDAPVNVAPSGTPLAPNSSSVGSGKHLKSAAESHEGAPVAAVARQHTTDHEPSNATAAPAVVAGVPSPATGAATQLRETSESYLDAVEQHHRLQLRSHSRILRCLGLIRAGGGEMADDRMLSMFECGGWTANEMALMMLVAPSLRPHMLYDMLALPPAAGSGLHAHSWMGDLPCLRAVVPHVIGTRPAKRSPDFAAWSRYVPCAAAAARKLVITANCVTRIPGADVSCCHLGQFPMSIGAAQLHRIVYVMTGGIQALLVERLPGNGGAHVYFDSHSLASFVATRFHQTVQVTEFGALIGDALTPAAAVATRTQMLHVRWLVDLRLRTVPWLPPALAGWVRYTPGSRNGTYPMCVAVSP
jgi:hypothetical protein